MQTVQTKHFSFDIPLSQREVIQTFESLMKTFNIKNTSIEEQDYYEKAKEDYLKKYRGAFKGCGDDAQKDYNDFRLEKYGN